MTTSPKTQKNAGPLQRPCVLVCLFLFTGLPAPDKGLFQHLVFAGKYQRKRLLCGRSERGKGLVHARPPGHEAGHLGNFLCGLAHQLFVAHAHQTHQHGAVIALKAGAQIQPHRVHQLAVHQRRHKVRAALRPQKAGQFLDSFYAGDVIGWVDDVPKDQGFVCYPPFYSGDYEKMFKVIEVTERDYFMFGTNDELEEFSDYLMGISQTTNRGVPLYVYSKAPKSRIIVPHQQVASLMVERLGKDEDIGDTMRIVPLKSENFRALRSQYMNPYIKPGSETASFGVLVDNKLIGVYAFSASPTLSNWDKHIETPTMYLLSDFPIAPTKYKRLAKLVLYAALSRESKLYAERLTNHRIRSLVTTAFTKRPVSMKYRGLFQLLNKKQLPGVDENETDMSKIYYNSGYQLNYGAPMGQWTLAEGLELWKKKHSQIGAKEDE